MILLADAIYCDSSVVGLPQPVMSYTPWAGADDFDDGAKDDMVLILISTVRCS